MRTPRKTSKPGRRNPPADGSLRLPHEQDESNQHAAQPTTRVMENAHDDVESGMIDTDSRGNQAREAFEKQRAPAPKGGERVAGQPPTRRRRGT